MNANGYPTIRPGTPFHDTKAAEWHRLFADVASWASFTASPPLRLERRGRLASLSFQGTNLPPGAQQTITVCVVETPAAGHARLGVRQVRYDDQDPRPGVYQWAGETFYALPELGRRPTDYDDMVFTGPTPTESASFLTARRDFGQWIVELPSAEAAGLRFATIILAPSTGSEGAASHITVQPKKPDAAGVLVNDGAEQEVFTWPGLFARDFTELQRAGAYILLVFIAGGWFAMQTIPFSMVNENASLPLGGC